MLFCLIRFWLWKRPTEFVFVFFCSETLYIFSEMIVFVQIHLENTYNSENFRFQLFKISHNFKSSFFWSFCMWHVSHKFNPFDTSGRYTNNNIQKCQTQKGYAFIIFDESHWKRKCNFGFGFKASFDFSSHVFEWKTLIYKKNIVLFVCIEKLLSRSLVATEDYKFYIIISYFAFIFNLH